MLKITVEGNKEDIKAAKNVLERDCFIKENCPKGITSCEECEKGRIEVKYIVKEDK